MIERDVRCEEFSFLVFGYLRSGINPMYLLALYFFGRNHR